VASTLTEDAIMRLIDANGELLYWAPM